MVGYPRFGRLRPVVAFSSFVVLLSLCSPRVVSAYSEDEAYARIELADRSVSSAFDAVLEAENAGANVSALIAGLNVATSLLVEAEVSSRNGEFGEVVEAAGRSVEVADGVRDEALSLGASALSHREFVFRASLIGSAVGVPVFLFFMFLLWRWFKGFYVRRILRFRPEVALDVDA